MSVYKKKKRNRQKLCVCLHAAAFMSVSHLKHRFALHLLNKSSGSLRSQTRPINNRVALFSCGRFTPRQLHGNATSQGKNNKHRPETIEMMSVWLVFFVVCCFGFFDGAHAAHSTTCCDATMAVGRLMEESEQPRPGLSDYWCLMKGGRGG